MPTNRSKEPIVPIGPSIAYVPLSRGKYALIDSADIPKVSPRKWSYASGYAKNMTTEGGIYLHRFLLNPAPSKMVDHRNRNTLDCRRVNLRICSCSENNRNRGLTSRNTSGVKGVTFVKNRGVYHATIMVNGKHVHLGASPCLDTAKEIRRSGEQKYFPNWYFH